MNVKLSRRDFPVLTEEIEQLAKGPRRTNRLAHLATLGLFWERALSAAGHAPMVLAPAPPPVQAQPPVAAAYQARLHHDHLAALFDGEAEP